MYLCGTHTRALVTMSNISLASSTNSRVDSAAKHIVVARICTDFYTQFLNNAADLQERVNDYMAKRDEICLGSFH